MKLNKNLKYFALIIALCSSILNSCNEGPTSLGYSLVKDTIAIYAISDSDAALISGFETYHKPMNYINTGLSLVGIYNDWKASTAIRFGVMPDTLHNLTESDIISCDLILSPSKYAVGDTAQSNFLSFGVHKINSAWTKETTPDEFFAGHLYSATSFAEFNGNIARKDTMDKIILPFDKSLIIEWLKITHFKNDTIWGIALMPKPSSSIVQQFFAQGFNSTQFPEIKLVYKNPNNRRDTVIIKSALEKCFVEGTAPETDLMLVQGALSYRSRLYFDMSAIPAFAGIHKAELRLTVNNEFSFSGNFPKDSIVRLDYYSSHESELKNESPILYYAGRWQAGTNTFLVPSISSAISFWNRRNGKGSLSLRFDNPFSEMRLNRIAFHSPNDPDPEKRPKLIIIYSLLDIKD